MTADLVVLSLILVSLIVVDWRISGVSHDCINIYYKLTN